MVKATKHTKIGDVPANWGVQTFEETFRVLSNNTLSRAELNDRGGSVRNVHYGDILTRFMEVLDCSNEDIPFLNNASSLTASAMPLQDGDVILADTAEDETVGKATEIAGLGDKKLVSGLHTIPCRVKKGDFASGWLGYYMNSHIYHDQVLPFITGIKVSSISKSAIAETLVLVPPKEEQKAIVESLAEIEMVIKNLEGLIAKRKAIKQGLLARMFPRKGQTLPEIRMPGFTDIWKQRKLGEVCSEFKSGDFIKADDIAASGGFPIFGGNGLRGYTDKYNHDGDYALIGRQGALCGNMNYSSGKACFTEHAVAVKANSCNDTQFLYYCLSTMNLGQYSSQSAQPGLAVCKLAMLQTMIPEKEEQMHIAGLFRVIDDLITLHERELEKYKAIKQGMMSELLTGKIRLV